MSENSTPAEEESISTLIANVNGEGEIVSVNQAWKVVADQNGFTDPNYGVGDNYLTVCRNARGANARGAREVAHGLERVLNGTQEDFIWEYICPAGKKNRWYLLLVTSVAGAEGQGAQLVHIPITSRKEMELSLAERTQALQKSEGRLAIALQQANLGYWSYDFEKREITEWSVEAAKILSIDHEDLPVLFYDYLDLIHSSDRDRVAAIYKEAVSTHSPSDTYEVEYRVVRPDGTIVWVREWCEVEFTDDGKPVGFLGTIQDITTQKAADEKLRQAQKMEAIGQLTGGIAHDFNNLLAIIQGNAELLNDSEESDTSLTTPILRSTARGAQLTQRLLAFSRRQPLSPRVIDLGALALGLRDMLTRTLGATIEIEIVADPQLWNALADPGQVEDALLNLVLNARDAMHEGGRLVIECANAQLEEAAGIESAESTSGQFVALSVRDEGGGMTPEVRARALEPFFTTKEVGRGSGLGLSMVYGFARQSNGQLTIQSEERRGTTVTLYLPRAEAPLDRKNQKTRKGLLRGKGESILVIEDDPDVCALTTRILEDLGYRVVAVGEAESARRVLSDDGAVDLVLSDIVLPGGTSGVALAEEARAKFPGLKIIFMSGYPVKQIKHSSFTASNHVLLRKPFARQLLAKTLREVLDGHTEV